MFGKLVDKYNSWILLLTLAITIASILLLPRLKTDVNFKQFFPENEPALAGYESFTKTMGSSEHVIIIAVSNKPSVFDTAFLSKVQSLQMQMDSMQGINKTMTLLSLKKYKQLLPGAFDKRPYIQVSHPERFARDSALIFKDYLLTQHFITNDAVSVKMFVQLSDQLSLNAIDSLVKKIDTATAVFAPSTVHLLGRKYMESEYKKLVNHEMKISLLLSILFVVLILWILHRSFAGVLLPLLCMVVSLIMLYGYMAIFNRPLTVMSNLFPTIILIVGISDVMHISSKFAYESLGAPSPAIAIHTTLREIGLTTFINSFTTAVGFLTLLTMSMAAMQSFGVDAAVGLMIAWANSIFLLPAILLRFKLAKSFSKPVQSNQWHQLLNRILVLTYTYPKRIAFCFLLVLIISFTGLFFINTNNFVLTSLPENNRLKTDYQFFDSQLGGGRSFELIIHTKNGSLLSHQPVIENIEKFEKYLEQHCAVTGVVSPVMNYKWLNNTVNSNSQWLLPPTQDDYDYLYSFIHGKENILPVKIIDSSNTIGRLYGHSKDIGRKKMEQLYEPMYKWINQNIDTSIVNFEITGPDYMTDIGHQLRIENMTGSFLLEILLVSAIIGIIYRSAIMILITFIANIIPVIIVGGIMGYFGIELRGATTAIFAIGYVIAVDDTLHFVNRFQLEKRKGLTTKEALSKTFLYTGRAMVMTSLILLGGFLILLHSSFGDVYMHGLLVSLIIFTALITELLITPVLINYFFSDNKKR
jgi:uncharacterized protein